MPNIYSSLYLYKEDSSGNNPKYENYVDALYDNRKIIEINEENIQYAGDTKSEYANFNLNGLKI